tara:strand:- start:334 stop:1014 length:681 start_codon:yes stop_codon:yes gene_type:complete
MSKENARITALANREGVFGFGLSNNNNLDLLNLVVLACAGIIIKIFFQANVSDHGGVGPASTTIWGYGITAFALFIMTFMSFYMSDKNNKFIEKRNKDNGISNENNFFTDLIELVMGDSIPIFLTFCVLIYVIYINFVHFNRINKGEVSDSYYTYSFYSSLLIIIQITLIIKYMYNSLGLLNKTNIAIKDTKQTTMIKSASYILVVINLVFVMIQHILLSFYSTDG